MADQVKKPQGNPNPGAPRAEAPAGPTHCQFEGCKHKIEKFGFCVDHFEMYMAGVVRGDGKKPLDFEVKLANFMRTKVKVA